MIEDENPIQFSADSAAMQHSHKIVTVSELLQIIKKCGKYQFFVDRDSQNENFQNKNASFGIL